MKSYLSSYLAISIVGIVVMLVASLVIITNVQAATCSPASFTRVAFGQNGVAVSNIQQCLIDLGYSIPAGATGYYGIQTRAAVKAFYTSALSLPDWDGSSVGPQGRTMLAQKFAAYSPIITSPVTPTPPPAPITNTTTYTGTIVCLPHKDTTGPQTMECAYGLRDNDGKYYSLKDTDPNYANIMNAPMNVAVTVTGSLTLQEDTKYQSVGVISVVSIDVSIPVPADQ
jgi:peptidoglycan hydrolase-like protein with peptidoglycan-binding domain